MKDEKVDSTVARPWYREPWPWILAAGPLIVVIAGIYTAWLAVQSNDGLVTDDYYRKGLAANQTIARSDEAARMGLAAGIRISGDTLSVRLQAADRGFVMPPTLALTINHPTRAGLDQSRLLVRSGDRYSGEVRLPAVSGLQGRGVQAGEALGVPLQPAAEFAAPLGIKRLAPRATWSPGAYQD